MSLLTVSNLQVSYGGIEALKGISFEVEEGQIVTLIGANGAGKSTTLRAISGLVKIKSGAITFDGRDITSLDTTKTVSEGIVMVPEGRRVFPNLTVLENLKIGAYLRKDPAEVVKSTEYVYDRFPRLKERHWQMAGTLSGGEQQMLAVGRALMARPRLLMMDEPSLGLAPLVVRDIFSIIKLLMEEGITILLIEQNANAALRAAHQGYVLETGRITMKGTGQELLNNQKIRDAYLGQARQRKDKPAPLPPQA
jgi:branched-chain amino acid transport system ATP-binding protein